MEKVNNKNKQGQNLIYIPQHSFTKFKNIDDFKELSFTSMHKTLNQFFKKFNKLKMLIHKQMKIKI